MKLKRAFFQRGEALEIAQECLGKFLFTEIGGVRTGGMIIEVEAYCGTEDKACHAYLGRKTARTAPLFEAGGIAYVYLCYGMHHLFNIVIHGEGKPYAILVRALQPTEGLERIAERRGRREARCIGPGKVAQALGITTAHSGLSLEGEVIYLEERGISFSTEEIEKTPRIGIAYAEEYAAKPWRFVAN